MKEKNTELQRTVSCAVSLIVNILWNRRFLLYIYNDLAVDTLYCSQPYIGLVNSAALILRTNSWLILSYYILNSQIIFIICVL